MIASDGTEFAWIGLALVIVVGIGLLIKSGKVRKVSVDAGPVHAKVDLTQIAEQLTRLETGVTELGLSVNHQEPGEPFLIDRVKGLENQLTIHTGWEERIFKWQNDSLVLLANQIGATLPPCVGCEEKAPDRRRQPQRGYHGVERRLHSSPYPTHEGEQ